MFLVFLSILSRWVAGITNNKMKKFTSYVRGFTLIELLVVIAIIGILASVVLVSLNTARGKGRDSHLIADVAGLRTGLEVAFNGSDYNAFFKLTANAGYPTLSDPNMVKTYADAVDYAPDKYNSPNNLAAHASGFKWVGKASSVYYYDGVYNDSPIVIITDEDIPGSMNGWIKLVVTKYAIFGRLSTGIYYCIDSTGKTNPSIAAPSYDANNIFWSAATGLGESTVGCP